MVNYLLKKSYQRKNFKEIEFDDLWNKDGVFTTMWIYNKPPKILFFKTHIDNLIKSLKAYKIYEKGIKSKILKLINENIDKTKPYNHLLRVALNKKTISISLRDRVKLNNKFEVPVSNILSFTHKARSSLDVFILDRYPSIFLYFKFLYSGFTLS